MKARGKQVRRSQRANGSKQQQGNKQPAVKHLQARKQAARRQKQPTTTDNGTASNDRKRRESEGMTAAGNLLSSIGNTPLVELTNMRPKNGARILLKLEGSNPGGSVKDRTAKWMITHAIEDGRLKRGMTILEATSGNTGIGLAMVGAALGYRTLLAIPEGASQERKHTLMAMGAQLIETPAEKGTDGAIEEVEKLREEETRKGTNRFFIPDQYANHSNWLSHYESTAVEILSQTKGNIQAFVAGMGTGGTLMGHARRFRDEGKSINVMGVQPEPGHSIQGLKNMTESRMPGIFKQDELTSIITRSDQQAFSTTQLLAREEGLFTGMSTGAAVSAALELAKTMQSTDTIVAISPDRGDRYLSTGVFRGA